MLTIELLRQNAVLKDLPDSALSAIAEMSRNDEQTVIGTRIGELHGQYDKDIFGITGIAKNSGEKSYDYAKRVLSQYKSAGEASSELQAKLDKANNDVKALTKKLADGGADEVIKQQLTDAQAQVRQLQERLTAKESEYEAGKAEYEKAIKDVHVDYAFAAATAGLKFKAGIPESVQKAMLNVAKAEVLAKGTPDFTDDGKGGKTLVLRGSDGNILNNAKNNLNPYTISELVMETSLKDIIDNGKQLTGGGTGPGGAGAGDNKILLDLSGAKSQIEADRMIETYLLANGITRDSAAFSEQSLQLRNDNNISELPIR